MLFAQNNVMISSSKRHQCHQNCCLNKRFRTCNGLSHPEITKLYAFSFSPVKSPGVSMRLQYTSGNVTDGHSFISSTKSFFGISYRQLSMPKDDFTEKQMSINVFHTTSALKSTILVHVNYLSYTQDGVVNI